MNLKEFTDALLGKNPKRAAYVYGPDNMRSSINKKNEVKITITVYVTARENETLNDIIKGSWTVVNTQEKIESPAPERPTP
jgi:23S rRNA maturation-related 3'-5' exoribonuclease YhaM